MTSFSKRTLENFKKLKWINHLLNFFAFLILLSLVTNIFLQRYTPAYFFMALCILILTLPNLIYPVFLKSFFQKSFLGKLYTQKINSIFFVFSIVVFALIISFIFFNINSSIKNLPSDKENVTVIVLGAGIKDGKPMSNLRQRLDAAGEYLSTNLDTKVIVSGGLNKRENLIEADVMKAYLMENWSVDPLRIFKESTSTDTYQNLKNSNEVIKKNNLSDNILIITNDFHMFRSVLFADSLGYQKVFSLPVKTDFILLTTFWFREILSMIKAILLINIPALFGY